MNRLWAVNRHCRGLIILFLWLVVLTSNSVVIYFFEYFQWVSVLRHVNCTEDRYWTVWKCIYLVNGIWTWTGAYEMPCTWIAKLWCIFFSIYGIPFNFFCIYHVGSKIYEFLNFTYSKSTVQKLAYFPFLFTLLFLIILIFLYAFFTYYTFNPNTSPFWSWPYGPEEWDFFTAFYVAFMQFPASVGLYTGDNPIIIMGNILFILIGLSSLSLCIVACKTVAQRQYELVMVALQKWYVEKMVNDITANSISNYTEEDADQFVTRIWKATARSYLAQFLLDDDKKTRLIKRYLWYCGMSNKSTQCPFHFIHSSCGACQFRTSLRSVGTDNQNSNTNSITATTSMGTGGTFGSIKSPFSSRRRWKTWKPKKRLNSSREWMIEKKNDQRPLFQVTRVRYDHQNNIII